MTLTKDTRRRLAAILKQALDTDEPLEQTLVRLQKEAGSAAPVFEAIARILRNQRLAEVARSRDSWFKALGWYFARLFMWGALLFAVGAYLAFGAQAANAVTWGLCGAVGYYLLIQVCTPLRLRKETGHLLHACNAEREALFLVIAAIEAEDGKS